MDKRAQAKKEIRKLRRLSAKMAVRVNKILVEDYDKKLYRLSRGDQYRLLTLRTWSIKYKVSLRYILHTLFDYYSQFMKRFKTSHGLGIRIPTIVGKRSLKVLKEKIAEDFTDSEHIRDWMVRRERKIIKQRQSNSEEDGILIRYKNIIDYRSPDEYVKVYGRQIRKKQRKYARFANDPRNKLRPYRDNPFL